jgi:hypothetical protein
VSYDFTGNFEVDFQELSKRAQLSPFSIVKLGFPLPPLPGTRTTAANPVLGQSQNITTPNTATESLPPLIEATNSQNGLMEEKAQSTASATQQISLPVSAPTSMLSSHAASQVVLPISPKSLTYTSRYKYTPSILLEVGDEDDDEVAKASVRGWKLSTPIFDVFTSCVAASNSLQSLTFVSHLCQF